MENIGIVTAFVFGLLSFVSPCVLPIVPGYISFISGFTLEEMKDGASRKAAMRGIVLNSLFFIMGFTLVFVILGATATTVGKYSVAWVSASGDTTEAVTGTIQC